MTDEDHGIRGGQLWHQVAFPCFTVYMVFGERGFLATTDPREQGNMVVSRITEDWQSGEWWTAYFREHGYSLEGQLRDVELNRWDEIILHAKRSVGVSTTG